MGLGNPGSKYKNTFHNVGHLMADFLLENNLLPADTIIAKNEGYMNESGNSAIGLLKKAKAKPEDLLIIHDDSDIGIGQFKLSQDRGSAGHKGVESIINKIGCKNFWRLRIGIRPSEQQIDPFSLKLRRARAGEFVLKKIKKEQLVVLKKVFEKAAAALA